MRNIEFNYDIGDEVVITDLNVKAIVVGLYYGNAGIQYQVSFFFKGDKRIVFALEKEIQPLEKANEPPMGFFKG